MRGRPNPAKLHDVRFCLADWHKNLPFGKWRMGFTLMALLGLIACTWVVSPATVAGPRTESGTCCSSPTASSPVASQETTSTASTDTQAQPADPPGTIDGAKNPEMMPDEVAYGLVFLAVAEPMQSTPEQEARPRAKIGRAGMSKLDTEAFLHTVNEYKNKLDALGAQVDEVYRRNPFPHPASTDWQKLADLDRQRQQLTAGTVSALPARLSSDGMRKLYDYLQQAKQGMKIIPESITDPVVAK